MNVLLRKITIISDEKIRVLYEDIEKNWFGKDVIKQTTQYEKAIYEYWIEFHVDQGRFYYGERKPIELPNKEGVYMYQTNTSHTKRGLDKSLEIIKEIMNRTKIVFPEWKINLYQIQNISLYRQFDKE